MFLKTFPQFFSNNPIIFIDAGNLFFAQKTLQFQIDFLKFKSLFPVNSIFYYFTAFNPYKVSQSKFLVWMKKNGFFLITRELEYSTYGFKGNLDTEITLYLITQGLKHEEIILVSGDGDFLPIVDYLRNKKKTIYAFSTKGHIKTSLLKSTNYFDLANLRNRITQ